MHRAVRQVLFTARQTQHHLNNIRSSIPQYASAGLRGLSSSSPGGLPVPPHSMRKYTIGLLSGLVLSGAVYYAYQGPSGQDLKDSSERPMSTSATVNPESEHEAMRKIIAVDDERLYTGSFPLSKQLPAEDVAGRKVLGMLTPEEATIRLRSMEESYNVGRNQGVWRYDIVQLPSNNPIEDDHAEKIVEVPDLAAEIDGQKTDWMFWGVFDGHRYVSKGLVDSQSTACEDLLTYFR